MRRLGPTRVLWVACALGTLGCAHGVELDLGAIDRGGAGGAFGPTGPVGVGGSGEGGQRAGASGSTTSTTGGMGTSGVSTSSTVTTGGSGGAGSSGVGGSASGAAGIGGGSSQDASADQSSAGTGGSGGASGASGAGGSSVGGAADDGGAGAVDAPEEPPPPVCPECVLRVQYRCFQNGGMVSQVELGLIVMNASAFPIALNTIRLRYWYSADGTGTQQATRDTTDVDATLSVHPFAPARVNSDAYIEVALAGTGMLAPGASTAAIRISLRATTPPSTYDQTDDHSFMSTGASYVDWTNVTAYLVNRRVWGVEPP
jgi:hypothetical protein